MAKFVKIITFMDDKVGRDEAEKDLTHLVNNGWVIQSAGGGGQIDSGIWGFIVLQKDDPDAAVPPYDESNRITY